MIKFNGEEWQIYFVSPLHPQLLMGNGEYGLGVCDDVSKEIYINKDLNNHYMKKVLAHELTHAAAFSYNVIFFLMQCLERRKVHIQEECLYKVLHYIVFQR